MRSLATIGPLASTGADGQVNAVLQRVQYLQATRTCDSTQLLRCIASMQSCLFSSHMFWHPPFFSMNSWHLGQLRTSDAFAHFQLALAGVSSLQRLSGTHTHTQCQAQKQSC